MSSLSFKIFSSFCLLLFIFDHSSATLWTNPNTFEPVVQTRYGQIRGIRVPTRTGQLETSFTQYIGVPYAQPPIGVNRFSDPVPIDNWPGVYDATNGRVMCPQVEQRFKFNNTPPIIESEDCLYLNIYAFNWDSSSVASPVLVYFHGGEFKYGGKDFYSLDTLPQRLGVSGLVLVTVNYRLGPLGFMSTETNNFRGNYGLKDMIMALRWVKSTINAFHGDPERIYIGGHDAGGIAASMMMLIVPNERLFAGAFASAGTVFTPWAFERSPNFIARRLSNSLGCYSRDSVRCLQRKSYAEIMSSARNLDLHFRPIVDSNLTMPLFQDEPEILYRNGLFAKVPFIAGISEKEGALDYYAKYDRISQIPEIRDKIKYLLSPYVRRYANLDVLSTLAEFQYFREEEIAHQRENPRPRLDNAQIDSRLIRLLGDYLYALPAEKALSFHSRGGAKAQFYVYVYENVAGRVQPTFGVLQYAAPSRIARDRFATTHMDDVFIMFRTLYNPPSPQLDNQLLGDVLNELRDSSGQSYRWTRYYAHSRNFMQIRYGDVRQSLNFRTDKEISFWNDLFDDMEELSAAPNPYFPEEEYAAYQAATWSLLGITLLLLIICIVLALVIFIKRRNDKRSLKLIRKRDNDDLPERTGVLD